MERKIASAFRRLTGVEAERPEAVAYDGKKWIIGEEGKDCEYPLGITDLEYYYPLVVKWGRLGRFYACSRYPDECSFTKSADKDIVETNEKCDKCGAPMVIITRNGSKFLGCSNYPECKNIKTITTGVKCPNDGCDGELVERKTRRGKVFYGCNKYPKCNYATWDKPLAEICPECGHKILVEKTTKAKGTFKMCPECKKTFPIEGSGSE